MKRQQVEKYLEEIFIHPFVKIIIEYLPLKEHFVRSIQLDILRVNVIAFHKGMIYSARCINPVVQVFNFEGNVIAEHSTKREDQIYSIAISDDEKIYLSTCKGIVILYDGKEELWKTGSVFREISLCGNRMIAIDNRDGNIKMFDLSKKLVKTFHASQMDSQNQESESKDQVVPSHSQHLSMLPNYVAIGNEKEVSVLRYSGKHYFDGMLKNSFHIRRGDSRLAFQEIALSDHNELYITKIAYFSGTSVVYVYNFEGILIRHIEFNSSWNPDLIKSSGNKLVVGDRYNGKLYLFEVDID